METFLAYLTLAEHSGDYQNDSVCQNDRTLCANIPGTVCVDTDQNQQGYFCPCKTGYELDIETGNCREESICKKNANLCNDVPFTICVATPHTSQGYFCPCQEGYKVDLVTGNCLPEQEVASTSKCESNRTLCSNIPGTVCVDSNQDPRGYFCTCREGFELDVETGNCREENICEKNTALCSDVPFTVCVATRHTSQGYFCPCKSGYEVDIETGNCRPDQVASGEQITVDVCSTDTSLCSDVPNTVCVTSRRSGKGYFCPCRRGYEVDYLTGNCRLISIGVQELTDYSDYNVISVVGGENTTTGVTSTTEWNRSKYFATMSTPAELHSNAITISTVHVLILLIACFFA